MPTEDKTTTQQISPNISSAIQCVLFYAIYVILYLASGAVSWEYSEYWLFWGIVGWMHLIVFAWLFARARQKWDLKQSWVVTFLWFIGLLAASGWAVYPHLAFWILDFLWPINHYNITAYIHLWVNLIVIFWALRTIYKLYWSTWSEIESKLTPPKPTSRVKLVVKILLIVFGSIGVLCSGVLLSDSGNPDNWLWLLAVVAFFIWEIWAIRTWHRKGVWAFILHGLYIVMLIGGISLAACGSVFFFF